MRDAPVAHHTYEFYLLKTKSHLVVDGGYTTR